MIEFTVNQIIAHGIGDYFLQSEWMVRNKRRSMTVAFIHGIVYALPFIVLCGTDIFQFIWIYATHALIDHFGLAAWIIRVKNFIPDGWKAVSPKHTSTMGFPKDTPDHIQFFVFVVVDNLLHIITNAVVLAYAHEMTEVLLFWNYF